MYIDRAVTENIVLDCVTMWVNNILYHHKEAEWEQILTRFLNGLGRNAVFVTNETGLGNIPADSLSRRYNRFLGEANRRIAASADKVIFMVSGIPMRIK